MRPRLWLALVSVLGACEPPAAKSVDAELGKTPPNVARVCVIRPSAVAQDTTMAIRDNGRLVGATRGATFVCWLAAPGDHQIVSIDDDTGPTLLQARAGKHYWLHQEVSALGPDVHAHLDWIDTRTASEMLDRCTTRVKASVPSGPPEHTDALAVTPKQ